MTDRRKVPRKQISKFGKILVESWQVPCTVRNLSEIGACLEVQTTIGIPAIFRFMMPNQTPQTCKVMWRDYTKLGVHFRLAAAISDLPAAAENVTSFGVVSI